MRLAFWPGLGGEGERVAALELDGVEPIWLGPRYAETRDWNLDALAARFVQTGATVYAGHSWGGAIAARAALQRPPAALVLLEGGFVQPPRGEEFVAEVIASAPEHGWTYGNDTLTALLRSYMSYEAEETLASLSQATRVLVVVAARVEGRAELAARVHDLVPSADVRLVDAGHDLVEDLGDELKGIVGGWLVGAVTV